MATTRFVASQKPVGSPRPKGRGTENAKDTLCRNVLIYGHCRYEDQGCSFMHDTNKSTANSIDGSRRSLNVDSPSFTPAALATTLGNATITARIANAATFTPRSAASETVTPSAQSEDINPLNFSNVREFTPQASYDTNTNGGAIDQHTYDHFNTQQTSTTAQYNPYLSDNNALGPGSNAYYPSSNAFAAATTQPLLYHLYAPQGLPREDLLAYQRTAHDFFLPEKVREDLQKRSEATLQVMPNSQLPDLEHYHSLVALDTNHHKNATIFGFPSWLYKAQSSKNGHYYCLRRIEGYRLTNEKAIQSVKAWKRVDNGSVVSVQDAFTTRAFGDASIIFVYEYHPMSKTLVEQHFTQATRYGGRPSTTIPVQVLWSYIVQIANAMKAVHSANLAIRCMDPSKVILTGKNRVRFSACSIFDVTQYESQRQIQELQQEDLMAFGKLILQLASSTLSPQYTVLEQVGRQYTLDLKEAVTWLCTAGSVGNPKTIDEFLTRTASQAYAALDTSFHVADSLTADLTRELENGRLARLVMKLGTINERADFEGQPNWSETGDRYMLKLMRDYIFHQVDAAGNPVVDLGHIVRCLNKLDAGVDEKILLTSRDEQSVYVVSYKELKKQVITAFGELSKPVKSGGVRGY